MDNPDSILGICIVETQYRSIGSKGVVVSC